MRSRFEPFERADGRWGWRLIAGNGAIIATDGGQGYENRADCVRVGDAVVRGAYWPGETILTDPLPAEYQGNEGRTL